MTDIIETVGEPVSDKPRVEFRIKECLDWLKDPANEPTIRKWADDARVGVERTAHAVDRQVTATKDIIVDALVNGPDAIFDDLLTRFLK